MPRTTRGTLCRSQMTYLGASVGKCHRGGTGLCRHFVRQAEKSQVEDHRLAQSERPSAHEWSSGDASRAGGDDDMPITMQNHALTWTDLKGVPRSSAVAYDKTSASKDQLVAVHLCEPPTPEQTPGSDRTRTQLP